VKAYLTKETMMKFMMMGSGGVGAYYGGLLAQQGNEVTFIARGAHLEAMRMKGLQIKSIFGDFTMDFILFCTKTYDTETAAQAILPAVGPQTTVLSLQNGVDAIERIGAIVGMEHMLGGATWISSAVESPGVVKQMSQFRRLVFGESDGSRSERVESLFQVLEKTGITVEITENVAKLLWTKFVFISANSSLACLTRLSIGEFRAVPETRRMFTDLMKEIEAVARAKGVRLDDDVVSKTLAFADASAPHIRPSMQLDVVSGRRTELESMVGVIGRTGRSVGVATPIADFVYAALLPVELKARS
jgi:2-dehydropantoate 2-reductase